MQIAVIGLGRFGTRLATELHMRGAEVIAMDIDEKRVDELKDDVTVAVSLDGTDERALRTVGVHDVDIAVVAIGNNMESAILCTAVLRRLGVAHIVSRATTRLQAEILSEVGAKRVIVLEEHMGRHLAQELIEPGVRERIVLASGHELAEVKLPEPYVGSSLKTLNLRARAHLNVVALQRREPILDEDGNATFTTVIENLPDPTRPLVEGETLVVVGAPDDIAAFTAGTLDLTGEPSSDEDVPTAAPTAEPKSDAAFPNATPTAESLPAEDGQAEPPGHEASTTDTTRAENGLKEPS